MKVLLDTNVLLDVGLQRVPFFEESDAVVQWCEAHPIGGFIAWHSLSNLYYLIGTQRGEEAARSFLGVTLESFVVAETSTAAAKQALELSVRDYEDALQVGAAIAAGADLIVTRDKRDFARSPVKAISPAEFLELAAA
ncbi:MAG: type II toxin-antitoxin system VapC family toxin [Rhodanobacteraceae bacterium]